jgi:2-polyprenyl-6-methoxyphenol hydroxylase-like FAD-dependent oxidoreductase
MLGPPEDTTYTVFNFDLGQLTLLFPQGRGRVRAYVAGGKRVNLRLHGEKDVPDFMKASVTGGLPEKFFDGARAAGPLATFEGADVWVEHPYHDGVVLVGDAAAASDPSWGQGLCLTVRDARVLRDALLEHDDWDAAGHAYAAEHDRHYGVIHTVEDWFTQLFMEPGSEADARRARALPLLTQDPSRMPDAFQSGPDAVTVDERARRRLFGEA